MTDIVWEDLITTIKFPIVFQRIDIQLDNLESYRRLTQVERKQARDGLLFMNYEVALQKYFGVMQQINKRESDNYRHTLDVENCLLSIGQNEILGMNCDKIKRVSNYLCQQTPAFAKKYEKICHFVVTLARFFLIGAQAYMGYYGLSSLFKSKYESEITIRVSDIMATAYRKKCQFYHHRIEASIRQEIRLVQYVDGANLNSQIYENVHNSSSLYTTVENVLMAQLDDGQFEQMRVALAKHVDSCFKAKIADIEAMIEEYRQKGIDWDFLTAKEASALRNILHNTLQQQCYSQQQKDKVRQLINSSSFLINMMDAKMKDKSLRLEPNTALRIMVNLVLYLLPHYSGYIRNYLKRLFRHFCDLAYGYSNYICLVFIENTQIVQGEFVDRLREGNLNLHEHLVKIRWREKILEDIPKMKLYPIGSKFKNSKVISIYISGFRCQNHDKADFWKNLLYHGQTYALDWQGGTDALLDLAKYNSKDKLAQVVGKYLGYILMEHFTGCLVNLIGFSLGTGVIQAALKTMKQSLDMINDVVFLGGVAQQSTIESMLFQYPFRLVNCYSPRDKALYVGLPIFQSGTNPVGLKPINLPCVQNIDTSLFTNWNGHRPTFIELRKRVQFGTDIFYTIDK